MKILAVFLVAVMAAAQAQDCPKGGSVQGIVKDASGAGVVGASVALDGDKQEKTNAEGRFRFECVASGRHAVLIKADTFSSQTLKITVVVGRGAEMEARLRPEVVETTVEASAGESVENSENSAGAKALAKSDIAQMSDDPDDFQRQLQTLAAASGGVPGQALVTVDGFQGSSRMPPKSAIAFIRVNPDMFSAEYEKPPYEGGRIEVFTKPGQEHWHGALFLTSGNSVLNAKDPFALSRAPTSKERYGFELSGPVKAKKSDFVLSFEKRDIDNYSTVNAVVLNPDGSIANDVESVAAPQRLYIGSARLSWQINAKNSFTTSYSASVSDLRNVGVGGTVLPDAGYDSLQAEHTIRAVNITTISPRVLHEARASFTWRNRDDTPDSNVPQVMVADAFTSGGVSTQALHSHEKVLELDDDLMVSGKKHLLKFGLQMLDSIENAKEPVLFNGQYTFGGALAPALTDGGQAIGTSVAINGLEQYRRAMLGLPGGAATSYAVIEGQPAIELNQFRLVLFVQDQWKLRPRLQVAMGLRYAMQTEPGTYANFAPRVGVSWSPDKKQRWVLRARTGLFESVVDTDTMMTAERLNGVRQRQLLVYGPAYGNPLPSTANVIDTVRQMEPGLTQTPSWQSHLGVEHELPHHWHVQANLYVARAWDMLRSRNVNSPENDSPTGPRPGVANENVFQFQQSGHLHGPVMFFGVDQHSLKRVQVFVGYIRMGLRSTSDGATSFPQSSTTDVGETARPSWQNTHRVIVFGQVQLPWKMALAEQLDSSSGQPYNIVTGMDNNGDGVFNDRPQYATAGSANAVATRYGSLTTTGGTGSLPRNAATMPWTVHLDMNLSRSFSLIRKDGTDSGKSVVLNLRSANVLNHTNVTAVGNTLGSPLFGLPYAADSGRRVEFGLRYNF